MKAGTPLLLTAPAMQYVGGITNSSDFPVANAVQSTFGNLACTDPIGHPCNDGFVAALNSTGSGLLYSTFLGGGNEDSSNGIALDSSANADIAGSTASSDFPTKNARQGASAGSTDAFVAKISNPAPDFALAATPQSATVARGQSATYTLTVTPQNGFNTAVSFACSGLPAGASCTFSPNPLTPAGAAATSTLTISTTAASAKLLPPAFKPGNPVYALWLPFSALGLLGLVFLPGRKSTRKSWLRFRDAALFLVLLFALVLGFACGGGSKTPSGGTGGGTGGTPVGTYTVVVSGASGSLQKTTSLTLTVQ